MLQDWQTPFEIGSGNQTTTWEACIAFHERLAQAFPQYLRFVEIGRSDGGTPVHLGVLSADGEFDARRIRAAGRTVFFNNNGIHPGEPEGIDICMALVRDLCTRPERLAQLGSTVLAYIPVYNVDGSRNRHDTSRVNQLGPEAFGFRGNARHLDLNRDFIKADSRNARLFAKTFTEWDPDVFVDTHTSNGADYSYAMTLIPTQPDKLGGTLGAWLRDRMLPELYADMEHSGWPMCPYVNTATDIPDDGLLAFADSPRYSTGYAALHHCIGFMPETHMLKPFADRYHSLRAFLDAAIAHTTRHGAEIRACRARDRAAVAGAVAWPVDWTLDESRHSSFRFHGYEAVREPSRIGHYRRLRFDRQQPFVKELPYFEFCRPTRLVAPPAAYLVPQAWDEVAQRLRLNGVALLPVREPGTAALEAYRIARVDTSPLPFEGRHLHAQVELAPEAVEIQLNAGDWLVPLGQPCDRFIVETLEPEATDSFFRWGFFDAVLDKKETYSAYVFEDEAERLLAQEPALREAFERWKSEHPTLLADEKAVLDFLFLNCRRYAEPEHRRVPVFRVPAPLASRLSA
ncbi:M14 family zinc carboxypeptidase [Variovorax rhizosphaerae]|uniref:M14 family zinc carboxypeptidase n=1 Tax=Variovorax rhizosphaerae TaxID=1836200 RepID=A0ABU8WD04_9BURK